ncbi:hypothetical protein V1478_006493 [Vespula squamosa]|uniref:Uncharacterized protein n=1 Tax=Vespula squamosa TaxID=30214 RepID=A0ABD2B804_VESSQ
MIRGYIDADDNDKDDDDDDDDDNDDNGDSLTKEERDVVHTRVRRRGNDGIVEEEASLAFPPAERRSTSFEGIVLSCSSRDCNDDNNESRVGFNVRALTRRVERERQEEVSEVQLL